MELVHRQLFRKIEAIDFYRFAALGGLVHEEPTGLARMRQICWPGEVWAPELGTDRVAVYRTGS